MKIKAELLAGNTIEGILTVVEICKKIETRVPITFDPYRSFFSFSTERDGNRRTCTAEVEFEGLTFQVTAQTTLSDLYNQRNALKRSGTNPVP